ncbi:uncharacterized protein LOC111691863 [Anoplophora glabripennis]|uniref:uncharacterized protein LOC111691863 n=1 Tax=Anoplophora glabripennis TaxID=217634 RepID=UPI000C76BF57|nr:uncharacterized protein LOC111691863 [Anoplophora glabripennis]
MTSNKVNLGLKRVSASDNEETDDEWEASFDRRVDNNFISNRAKEAVLMGSIIVLDDSETSDHTVQLERPSSPPPLKKRKSSSPLPSPSRQHAGGEGPSTKIIAYYSSTVERAIDDDVPTFRTAITSTPRGVDDSISSDTTVELEQPSSPPQPFKNVQSSPQMSGPSSPTRQHAGGPVVEGPSSPVACCNSTVGRPIDDDVPISTPGQTDGLDIDLIRTDRVQQHIQFEEFKTVWYGGFKECLRTKENEFKNEIKFRRESTRKTLEKVNAYRRVLDEIAEGLKADMKSMDDSLLYIVGFADTLPERLFNLPDGPPPPQAD